MNKQFAEFIKKYDREPSFPGDWIAPGEFQFCVRCGWTLRPVNAPKCVSCRKWDGEEDAKEFPGIKSHHELSSERTSLAQSRVDADMEPLFWMKDQ